MAASGLRGFLGVLQHWPSIHITWVTAMIGATRPTRFAQSWRTRCLRRPGAPHCFLASSARPPPTTPPTSACVALAIPTSYCRCRRHASARAARPSREHLRTRPQVQGRPRPDQPCAIPTDRCIPQPVCPHPSHLWPRHAISSKEPDATVDEAGPLRGRQVVWDLCMAPPGAIYMRTLRLDALVQCLAERVWPLASCGK